MIAPAHPRGPLAVKRTVDVRAEYERQSSEGARFVQPRVDSGTVVTAVLHE